MKRNKALSICIYVLIVIISIWSLFPLLWGIVTSLKVKEDIFTSPPQWIPASPTLENYYSMIVVGGFTRNILNSLLISGVATVISLFGGALAAYSLGRFRFIGDNLILILILSSMMVPGLCNLIPIYVMLSKLKLLSTYFGIIMIYGSWGIPWAGRANQGIRVHTWPARPLAPIARQSHPRGAAPPAKTRCTAWRNRCWIGRPCSSGLRTRPRSARRGPARPGAKCANGRNFRILSWAEICCFPVAFRWARSFPR